ncbi:MAG: hypothetical protein CMF67_07160 [Magnetovibrio sp.]|nr:hypothetical protein [Magnetovibrio sp.]
MQTASGHSSQTAVEKRLIVGGVDQSFDSRTTDAIGPWCFFNAEDVVEGWEELLFETAYTDTDILYRDAREIREFAESLAVHLTATFNARHGKRFSPDFWQIILLPWVYKISEMVWKRFKEVLAFIENRGHTPYVVMISGSDPKWRFGDVLDMHTRIVNTVSFNYWLTSQIVRRVAPAHWRLEIDSEPISVPRHLDPVQSSRSRIKRLLADVFFGGRCRRVVGIRSMSFPISLALSLFPAKVPWRFNPPEDFSIVRKNFSEAYVELVLDMLWKLVPQSLSAEFDTHLATASQYPIKPGKINLVGPCLVFNEAEKFRCALASENGELIVCTQHGGSGIQKINGCSAIVENKRDAYLSWGWTAQEDDEGRIISLPAPALTHWRDRHSETEPTMYLVGQSMRVFAHRLETTHQSTQTIGYRQDKARFLACLPDSLRGQLYLRPYPDEISGLDEVGYFKDRFPWLRIFDGPGKEFHDALMRARLLVVDQYGSVFVSAMVANMPIISFADPKIWPVSKQAVPVFSRFEDMGIIQPSPDAAAAKVAEVWDDIDDWWRRDEVQGARMAFCNQFARTSRLWPIHWLKALWRL